jgi:phosphatidylglycerophosphate synthase
MEIKMGAAFWVKRFLLALAVAFVVLFVAELAKGHSQVVALQFAGLWGLATGTIFTLASYVRYRRNPACWLPSDPQA